MSKVKDREDPQKQLAEGNLYHNFSCAIFFLVLELKAMSMGNGHRVEATCPGH